MLTFLTDAETKEFLVTHILSRVLDSQPSIRYNWNDFNISSPQFFKFI